MSQVISWKDIPKPPSCVTAVQLQRLPSNCSVAVAGLVIVRQRPATAKGVIFLTLEDETGVANVIVWKTTFEKYRREVTAGRLLRVTGRLQNQNNVVHVVAKKIDDISHLLDELVFQHSLPSANE